MNCLSYALFGYAGNLSNDYPFAAYFRGLTFNIKMAELLFPGWRVHVTLDRATYDHFKAYFDYMVAGERLDIEVVEHADLCMHMLQRMAPLFNPRYDRVLCRDTDSLTSYRERQAVEYWVQTGRIAHCMTDSVSHNIALMGGMVGFQSKEFREAVGVDSFKKMTRLAQGIDFRIKGADQVFLNRYVLPRVAHSLVEHYLLGMPQSFRGECYNYIQDIDVPEVSRDLQESNLLTEHIGASGFNSDRALIFFDKYFTAAQQEFYNTIEDQFKEVHYWRLPV